MMSRFNPVLEILANFIAEHGIPSSLRVNLGYGMKLALNTNLELVSLPSHFFHTPDYTEQAPVDLDQIIESLFPAEQAGSVGKLTINETIGVTSNQTTSYIKSFQTEILGKPKLIEPISRVPSKFKA